MIGYRSLGTTFSRNHADNRLSPWLHLHPLNANNLGHAALHPVIGFDRTVERVFKFCAGGRHRDHVAFADAVGSAHLPSYPPYSSEFPVAPTAEAVQVPTLVVKPTKVVSNGVA